MENKILGLHHITAIAGDAKRNFDFYSKTSLKIGQKKNLWTFKKVLMPHTAIFD